MAQVNINGTALLKLLMHAAKYPASAINGLLLGSLFNEDALLLSNEGAPRLQVADIIPLFHEHLNLTMALEAALIQVDAYARSRNLEVVGLYHANEVVDDTRLCSAACTIADKLQQQSSPHAVIFLVDNNQLGNFLSGKCESFLQLYERQRGASGWKASARTVGLQSETLPKQYISCIGDGKHRQLADFDDHLDDLTRDWTNPSIVYAESIATSQHPRTSETEQYKAAAIKQEKPPT